MHCDSKLSQSKSRIQLVFSLAGILPGSQIGASCCCCFLFSDQWEVWAFNRQLRLRQKSGTIGLFMHLLPKKTATSWKCLTTYEVSPTTWNNFSFVVLLTWKMFALIQVKDSLAMRDGIIGNLLKTALSHILKSHIFAFAVSVFFWSILSRSGC